jgi:hypothetical protein
MTMRNHSLNVEEIVLAHTWSLAKAVSEPVKVTPPMKVPRKMAPFCTLPMGSMANVS